MNGPEHYREAERLVANARYEVGGTRTHMVSVAQVHATLALAAATADSRTTWHGPDGSTSYIADNDAWVSTWRATHLPPAEADNG